MTIGIDASRIEDGKKTGVENYAYEVIKKLVRLDGKNNYILYSCKPLTLKFNGNVKSRILKFPLFWTHIRLSAEMLFHPPDVLFIPAHTVPIIHPRKTIAVIHGLEYEYFPKSYSFLQKIKNKIGTYFSSKWARIIIAPSNNTKDDLVKMYKINPEKVRVIYPGIPSFDFPADDTTPGKAETPYLLFIGRIEHRKNIIRIVKAYEKIKRDKKTPHRLVLSGKNGHGFEEITKYISHSEFREDIDLTGYVAEQEKNILFNNASVFVFPTLYEGFGFPILEAMSRGIPVVTSNKGSAPEIAGSAALLVNPESIDEIADSIYKLITNSNLSRELAEKGRKNAQRFNWDKCVKQTMKLITSNI